MTDFDDERARAREAILKRRAKLVAYAVAAGVAMPACGGKSSEGQPCLSFQNPGGGCSASGGTPACLSAAGSVTAGSGGGLCLSICLGMPYGGTSGGGHGPCLSGTGPCLSGAGPCLSGGAPPRGEGGVAGEGGAAVGGAGSAGEPPISCLSAPLGGAPPFDDSAGGGGGDDDQ